MSSNILDNPALIKQIDISEMLPKIDGLANNLVDGYKLGLSKKCKVNNYKAIVFFGLGGSGIAGEIVHHKLLEHSNIPILTIKNTKLPAFIDKDTLCIALSYSGNTTETLACYKEAFRRKSKITAITSGGTLAKIARKNDDDLILLPDYFQPRQALGFLVGGALGHLEQIIDNLDSSIMSTAQLLISLKQKYCASVKTASNPAKKIALDIRDRLPLIYACQSLGAVCASRWKNQINENANCPAYANHFPELSHNEIMAEGGKIKPIILYLKNPDEDANNLIANSITLKLMEPECTKILEVASDGDDLLQKMLSIILLGDYVSTYLAILNEIDPTSVDKINQLKKELSQKTKKSKILEQTKE
ncbi:MAG: bifunctional phosphoglucose/phosphomannose isomerase [Actinobacteria bacterium]|nr:MAG: bifunctional phosphoglucose/phosphomannose isomerase [Actinomycetota bacterium]